MGIPDKMLIAVLVLSLFACKAKQQGGTVEGSVAPAGTQASISAERDGKAVLAVPAAADGRFTLALATGTYRIIAVASGTTGYRAVDNVVVREGEIIVLPAIDLGPTAGKAVLYGKVLAPQPGSEVVLLREGVERASIRTDSEGKYEFRELPAGSYVVLARMQGNAEDNAQIVVTGEERIERNVRLFPVTALEGVDWTAGKIRAAGIGKPPENAPSQSVRRAMAQRAALADAQRNLLRIVGQIRLNNEKSVQDMMQGGGVAGRIQGFLQGFTVVRERDLENGQVEVLLELPLNGSRGLSRVLAE